MKKGVIATVATIAGAIGGAAAVSKLQGKTIEMKDGKVDKFRSYYNVLNQWLTLKQEGKSLAEWFRSNGYKKVAIYGMGEVGNRLCEELKGTDIEVAYGIDKNPSGVYTEIEVHGLEDDLPEADVVVVSAVFAFNETERLLEDKLVCPIVSLEDVVYEI